ncbi:uncharacterized protein F4822DRAFT_426916 [Hypoxylon trugodes]|uniref:uncharacterized protein n=1 Tax=Hypoxylon trugodes TaxID=326681 RepID=UPI00219472DC|nr:uncharacterized protein F4822DRAFT_426916 [Hypoxylon trugodes]KAI1391062.1 hypothetical protein F4822DRAFT_426916 [Hypoxylon trugodes]
MAQEKFILYSFVGSQWANVAHLGLAEKGFKSDDYEVKEVDLVKAENFNHEYLKINPNGTIPSLTSPSLERPLIESTDILRFLDETRGTSLVPSDPKAKEVAQKIIDLVHSNDLTTNLILLQAHDHEEMNAKRSSMWNDFVRARQAKLEEGKTAHPNHPFYGPKSEENGALYRLYTSASEDELQRFYETTHDMYRKFATGLDKLDTLLVLPYAVGDQVTEADFHIVPWLSHALWGAGTEPSDVQNFGTLEALIQKTMPGFEVKPRIKEWWSNISKTRAFKEVYPQLH